MKSLNVPQTRSHFHGPLRDPLIRVSAAAARLSSRPIPTGEQKNGWVSTVKSASSPVVRARILVGKSQGDFGMKSKSKSKTVLKVVRAVLEDGGVKSKTSWLV